MLGAGFHKAAIEFIDNLQEMTDTRIVVEDETDYFTERDFEKMRNNHFYAWLAILFDVFRKEYDKGAENLCLSWSTDSYTPQEMTDAVVSPFGYFRVSDVTARIENEGISSFAHDYFIWDNPKPDARLFRGLALNSLWEECYFMPSEKSNEYAEVNDYIIAMLEKAAQLDPSLPFPKKEYEEICKLHGHNPISTCEMPDFVSEFPIGYRRGKISYKIGNLSFAISGNFIKTTDENTLVLYDGDGEPWHTVRCTAFTSEEPQTFQDMEEKLFLKKIFLEENTEFTTVGTAKILKTKSHILYTPAMWWEEINLHCSQSAPPSQTT